VTKRKLKFLGRREKKRKKKSRNNPAGKRQKTRFRQKMWGETNPKRELRGGKGKKKKKEERCPVPDQVRKEKAACELGSEKKKIAQREGEGGVKIFPSLFSEKKGKDGIRNRDYTQKKKRRK